MSLIVGGATTDVAVYNNTTLDKVICDGIEVFESGIPITFVEGGSSTTERYKAGSTVSRGSYVPSGWTLAGWSMSSGSTSYVTSFVADRPMTVYRVLYREWYVDTNMDRIQVVSNSARRTITAATNAYWGYNENINYPNISGFWEIDIHIKCDIEFSGSYVENKCFFYWDSSNYRETEGLNIWSWNNGKFDRITHFYQLWNTDRYYNTNFAGKSSFMRCSFKSPSSEPIDVTISNLSITFITVKRDYYSEYKVM